MQNTDDLRIANIDPLMAPRLLMKELPLDDAASDLVTSIRSQAAGILAGHDPRLLVVAGPCSIHDPKAALEYAERLTALAETHRDTLLLVMRVYFEKPRTSIGWKGLINDPAMDNTFDINRGLKSARGLLLDLARMGMAAGTEFLDTITPQYIADLVAWGAIGARTTESQVHRQLASGLSMPVGFKNGTAGSVQIALDAIRAARFPHHFLSVTKDGVSAIVSTVGNEDCHLILRGSSAGINYDSVSLREAATLLEKSGLPPYVMIDCSHGNSRKDHRRQKEVAANLASQISGGTRAIAAVMLESHLVEGRQELGDEPSALTYGQSVTDACLGWEDTVEAVQALAEGVAKGRGL